MADSSTYSTLQVRFLFCHYPRGLLTQALAGVAREPPAVHALHPDEPDSVLSVVVAIIFIWPRLLLHHVGPQPHAHSAAALTRR